jgi:virginiamycin B lyase
VPRSLVCALWGVAFQTNRDSPCILVTDARALLSVSILLVTFSLAQAASPTITLFRLPEGTSPDSVAPDASGRIFFTDPKANRIVGYNPIDSSLRALAIPTRNARLGDLISGAGSSLVFTETRGGKIGRLDSSSGIIHEYPAPDSADDPSMLALGPTGTIFFTCPLGDLLGALDPSTGQFSLFAVPTPGSDPYAISLGPAGSLFFSEPKASKIARFDLSAHSIEEFAVPTPDSRPLRLVCAGSQIFFTEYQAGKLGRFSPAYKTFKEWNSPGGPSSQPEAIVIDHNGMVWYCETTRSALIRFNPNDESFWQMPLPQGASSVHSMEVAPDGRVWMALGGIGALGALRP